MSARVIVTGGAGVIGTALVRALCAKGARVAITYHRSEARARALEAELGVLARPLDLTRLEAVGPAMSELADALSGVDAFVHCAGRASMVEPPVVDALSALDPRGFQELLSVNVTSAAFAMSALADRFGEAGGNVVLVGSINGVKPVPAPVPYATSKAALVGLAQALAKELGPKRIRVNVLAPGLLDAGAGLALPAALRADYLAHTALRRFATAEEIARSLAWFALENTYVDGRTVVLDGGL